MWSSGGCQSSFSFPVELKTAYNPATANNPVALPDNVESVYGGTSGNLTFRHKGRSRCTMVFVDGHVESMHITQLQERHVKLDAPVTGW
jgi:prepilin-type processing-associated H-X9-DG protein